MAMSPFLQLAYFAPFFSWAVSQSARWARRACALQIQLTAFTAPKASTRAASVDVVLAAESANLVSIDDAHALAPLRTRSRVLTAPVAARTTSHRVSGALSRSADTISTIVSSVSIPSALRD